MSWNVSHIAWVDVETTGVQPEVDLLLEVALVLTSVNLHEVARGVFTIRHESQVLERIVRRPTRDPEVNDFIWDMHTSNGLLEACQSKGSVSTGEADERLSDLLEGSCGEDPVPMGGCSAWIDRCMLRLYLPKLYSRLTHRTWDASAMRMALANWANVKPKKLRAGSNHRALEDTLAAIKMARRNKLFMQRAARGRERIQELEKRILDLESALQSQA